jgi:plasmid stabilization system protein ParE
MYSLVFKSEVGNDIQTAYDWYNSQKHGLGDDFVACVEVALSQIQEFPLSTPIVYKNIHRKLIKRFPYAIFFDIKSKHIRVLAILHERRRPKELLNRV